MFIRLVLEHSQSEMAIVLKLYYLLLNCQYLLKKYQGKKNLLGCRSGNSLTAHVQQGFKVSFPPRFKKDTIMRSIINFKTMKLCALCWIIMCA